MPTDAEESDTARELWGVIKKTEDIVLETFLKGWKIEIWLLAFIWSLGDACRGREKKQNHSEDERSERQNDHIWQIQCP